MTNSDLLVNDDFQLELPPMFSLSYFHDNLSFLLKNGFTAFDGLSAEISMDDAERAEYPDGTIRYDSSEENESAERTESVTSTSRDAVTYQDSDKMIEVDSEKVNDFASLVEYLQGRGCSVTLYLAPFSATQSDLIYSGVCNPGFIKAEEYLHGLAEKYGCELVGGYDAGRFGLGNERFIDRMHLDKIGNKKVWESRLLDRGQS